ncbi:unnamed protein product, partial [Ectocarpus fasciculatus]
QSSRERSVRPQEAKDVDDPPFSRGHTKALQQAVIVAGITSARVISLLWCLWLSHGAIHGAIHRHD